MRPVIEHDWNLSPQDAKQIQLKLRTMVKEESLTSVPKIIAGTDVSYNMGSNILFSGVVVLKFPECEIIEKHIKTKEVKFPYIPGLLSFRETPALIDAFCDVENEPDVIFVDGQGVAHPRYFGIASHIGVLLNIPTIGVAKSILCGKEKEKIIKKRGEQTDLIFENRIVGKILVTKDDEEPVVVSVGHKITLEEAVYLTLKTSLGFRIPEPTRIAHNIVNEERRKNKDNF